PHQPVNSQTKASTSTSKPTSSTLTGYERAKAVAQASVKPVVKSDEPEPELTYEQEKEQHRIKLEQAVKRAKEKRGL
ncbi:hypothetical protein, partial [Vibrio parahaemolyticus]